MPQTRKRLGDAGERAALEVYRGRGYRLVERNWRTGLGELDLVLRRGGLLVFCEVKTRASRSVGAPFEAVTAAKRRRVRALAEAFIAAARVTAASYRFDVASVWVGRDGRPSVHLFEDAF